MSKFLEVLKGVVAKEGEHNGLLGSLIGQISNGVALAGQFTTVDESLHVKVAARTLLDYEEVLRKSVDESPSPWDNLILDEAIEIAHGFVPGYIPVA
jgi:hypothetical protein